jgi:hypothetical protein
VPLLPFAFVFSSYQYVVQEYFEHLDDLEVHVVVQHTEKTDDDACDEVPASFQPCSNIGPERSQICAHRPEVIKQVLEAFRQARPPFLKICPPRPEFQSNDIFGLWRGIEGHNNSCYFDVLAMAMFAFHNCFDDVFAEQAIKQAHSDGVILMRLLTDLVVRPLRERMFVPRSAFATIRQHLSEITKVPNYASFGQMDPSELLMHFDQHLPAGLKCASCYQSDSKLYSDVVVSPTNRGNYADLTAQKLFDMHCQETGLIFDTPPKAFFLQMRLDTSSEQW